MAKTQIKPQTEDGLEKLDVAPESSSEIAVITPEDIQAAKGVAAGMKEQDKELVQSFMNWLAMRAEGDDQDTFAVMASIMRDVLSATNPAEVLAEQSTLRARDILHQPLILHGFEIRAGDYDESIFQHYAAMTVSRPGSEVTRIVCCGANKVLMKLMALDQFGEWPQAFWFTGKEGKKGLIIDIVSA